MLHRRPLLRQRRARRARARCSPPATTRPTTTASSCAARGRGRSARTAGLAEIRDLAQQLLDDRRGQPGRATGARPATITERDLLADYAAFLRGLVDLSGVAAAQGRRRRRQRHGRATPSRPCSARPTAAGAALPQLPLDVVPLYFELDGTFPNHEANPLEPENLRDLQRAVVEHGADLGLAFDGDADRCFVVDERGEPVSPSAVTALVATREIAKEQAAGRTPDVPSSTTSSPRAPCPR